MTNQAHVDIANKPSPHSAKNKAARVLWGLVQATLFRHSPRPCHRWRTMLLRLFGGNVSPKARVYPKAKIWGPWNLVLHEYATIANDVDVYCVDTLTIGAHTTISQYSYLCGATHDFEHPNFPLQPMPITIGRDCWIAADCFVAPGVTIHDGVVVGARSSVFSDLAEWQVCAGTPAKAIRKRVIREDDGDQGEAS